MESICVDQLLLSVGLLCIIIDIQSDTQFETTDFSFASKCYLLCVCVYSAPLVKIINLIFVFKNIFMWMCEYRCYSMPYVT